MFSLETIPARPPLYSELELTVLPDPKESLFSDKTQLEIKDKRSFRLHEVDQMLYALSQSGSTE